jgi:hypothetical protein
MPKIVKANGAQTVGFIAHFGADELNFVGRQRDFYAIAAVRRVGFTFKKTSATGTFGRCVFRH